MTKLLNMLPKDAIRGGFYDIGAGTGEVMLEVDEFLKSCKVEGTCKVEGIELQEDIFKEAKENIQDCNVNLFLGDFLDSEGNESGKWGCGRKSLCADISPATVVYCNNEAFGQDLIWRYTWSFSHCICKQLYTQGFGAHGEAVP